MIQYVDWRNPPVVSLDIIYERYQGVEVTSDYNPDSYFSTSLIGKGAQGSIYKVIDTETNKVVALKFSKIFEKYLSVIDVEIKNSCALGSAEAFTSSLSLPLNWNVIAEPSENVMVISMPYIDGPTFSGELGEETFISGLFELIIALKAMHDIGYMHNDLHKGNLLTCVTDEIRVYNINNIQYVIDNPLKPVIIDFGISIKIDDFGSSDYDYWKLKNGLKDKVSGLGREIIEDLSELGDKMLLHGGFHKYRSTPIPAGRPVRIFENIQIS